MIRIGKRPFIYEDDDRWGQRTGTYSVMEAVGWVTDEHWKNVQEFERYDVLRELAERSMSLGQAVHISVTEPPGQIAEKLPDMARLLKLSGGYQLWQFNMKQDRDGTMGFLRTYALFGEVSLKRWRWWDSIRLLYLRWKCARMNRKARK